MAVSEAGHPPVRIEREEDGGIVAAFWDPALPGAVEWKALNLCGWHHHRIPLSAPLVSWDLRTKYGV